MSQPASSENQGVQSGRILDIRTYRIVSGRRDEFDQLFREQSRPMLERHGIRVVAAGPSLIDDDGYTLVRSFDSLEQRREQLDGFYGSAEWLENHDERVTELIETYHTVVGRRRPSSTARRSRRYSRSESTRSSQACASR